MATIDKSFDVGPDGDAELRPAMYSALSALLAGMTQPEAAEAAGVSPRTIARWLERPEFRAALRKAGNAITGDVIHGILDRVTAGQELALNVLQDLMLHGRPGERRAAAACWLSTWRDMQELVGFSDRLAALEAEIK